MTVRIYLLCELCAVFFLCELCVPAVFGHKVHKVLHEEHEVFSRVKEIFNHGGKEGMEVHGEFFEITPCISVLIFRVSMVKKSEHRI
jgi:hypothetical protein